MKNKKSIKKDIAIIGLSGTFPKSENLEIFWDNLKNGKELVHFYTEEEMQEAGMSEVEYKKPNFINAESFVENPEGFDFKFFGYSPDEAAIMDPQTRLLHEHVWLALEDAGYDPYSYASKIGLFVSSGDNLNWRIYSMAKKLKTVAPFYRGQLANRQYAGTLVSYKLNLKGPVYFIDTACSSSLTALHLAYRSLLLRECKIAVVGGVKINTAITKGYQFEEGMIFSKDGHCRAFDADSSGTIFGEGIGVVVLKRLEDALDSNDEIHAVVKATATNNDGNRKIGFTAPSIQGQTECIKSAHQFAGIEPSSISYIEAHGTGTKLGDPIEIAALNAAFGNERRKHSTIGTVKSNMGHLDNAAGIAGLIKTVFSLKNRTLAPSLHFNKPNPEIQFNDGPLQVNDKLKPWELENGTPLRAGINSFGIGGTNVHVIMEEPPRKKEPARGKTHKLIRFSAKTTSSLDKYQEKLNTFLKSKNNTNLDDTAYTLITGRSQFDFRRFLVAKDKEEAIGILDQPENGSLISGKLAEKKATVFMFPGQGSQYFEMGKGIYDQEPYFKEIMDEGFQLLSDYTGKDYKQFLYNEQDAEPDTKKINETAITQPLLYLIEYALAKLLMKWGVEPDHMIGHSLGEYVAATISGVFSFEDGLKLLVRRATLMNSVSKGAMLSVSSPESTVKSLIPPEISIATINSNKSCVVSGTIEDIDAFSELLEKEDISNIRLKTSHAFHSKMMDPILEKYKEALEEITFGPLSIPFISNLTGRSIVAEEATSPDYWVSHLRNTVCFSKGIQHLISNESTLFIEVGPGNTLKSLVQQNSAGLSADFSVINLIRHPKTKVEDTALLTNSIGRMWIQGVDVDWTSYYLEETRSRVSAPTYVFDKHDFPVKVDPLVLIRNRISDLRTEKLDIEDWFYVPSWKRTFLSSQAKAPIDSENFLIFSDQSTFTNHLKEALIKDGKNVIEILQGTEFKEEGSATYSVNPLSEEAYAQLKSKLVSVNFDIDQVIYTWSFTPSQTNWLHQHPENNVEIINDDYRRVLNIYKGLHIQETQRNVKFTFITNAHRNVLGFEKEQLESATVLNLLQVSSQENPALTNCSIDVDYKKESQRLIANVIKELYANWSNPKIAFRNQQRWVGCFTNIMLEVDEEHPKIKKNGTYLVTGGLGYVGLILAEHLLTEYHANVILLGRSTLPEKSEWDAVEAGSNVEEKINKLKKLQDIGGTIKYMACDAANYEMLSKVVESIEAEHGTCNGVIHAAGNISKKDFKSVWHIDEQNIAAHFKPKVNGLINLYAVFKDKNLDFVWNTSSISAIFGGLTYAVYGAANAFMDAFVNAGEETLENWYSINLDGLGNFAKNFISRKELIEVFEKSFAIEGHNQLIVSTRNIEDRTKNSKVANKQEEVEEAERIMVERPELGNAYVKPTGEIEEDLAKLWEQFFGIDKVGIQDDFFELGGDSLQVMTMSKRIFKHFGVEVSLKDIYDYSNVKSLAEEIALALQIKKMQTVHQSDTNLNEITI